ncbi:hypothetical protein DL765_009883 [Monosporascus sp. GIB2]|nr:hypothetical protein DL765_009883 [Monosporascus sp. GIB2]
MARARVQTAAQNGRLSSAPKYQGRPPQGIQSRKGAPKQRDRLQEQPATKPTERNRPRPSSTISETLSRRDPPAPVQSRGRKRKPSIENEFELEPSPDPDQKRQRTSRTHAAENTVSEPAVCSGSPKQTDPIAFWTKECRWPEERYWPEKTSETDPTMERLLAREKSWSNLSRKRSNSATSTTRSDQKPREEKSAPYRARGYPLLLQAKGSYMDISELGITDTSEHLVRGLLSGKQSVPKETLFDDDIFVNACRNLGNKNEARIIQDISRLIVPSVELLALRTKDLRHLTESVNEGWHNSMPLSGTRPQPDYSVGFKRDAFTEDQLTKLLPFIGNFIAGDQSLFLATYYMYFPFLTCEVKCGAAALDVADRQNAHSMTLAVRHMDAGSFQDDLLGHRPITVQLGLRRRVASGNRPFPGLEEPTYCQDAPKPGDTYVYHASAIRSAAGPDANKEFAGIADNGTIVATINSVFPRLDLSKIVIGIGNPAHGREVAKGEMLRRCRIRSNPMLERAMSVIPTGRSVMDLRPDRVGIDPYTSTTKMDPIASLTRQLVDHEPQLFLNTIRSLHDFDLNAIREDSGSTRKHDGTTTDENVYALIVEAASASFTTKANELTREIPTECRRCLPSRPGSSLCTGGLARFRAPTQGGMLAMAHLAPLKYICIGISPYENRILPPFVSAISYSPSTCSGTTPSVQILGRAHVRRRRRHVRALEVHDRARNAGQQQIPLKVRDDAKALGDGHRLRQRPMFTERMGYMTYTRLWRTF